MALITFKQLRLGCNDRLNHGDGTFRRHPQFLLRALATASAAIGMILAFSTLMSAIHLRWNMTPARVLSGVAMIPVSRGCYECSLL